MRTLSGTLLAAQRSGSASPVLGVELHDRDVGVVRLRWTRWYTGSENAGPCAAAVPADGSLLRARLDGTTMYHSRVASPGSGSTYSSWTSLGTVASAPRLGLAAAGTRALLAFVNSAGTGVQVRESTDSGASFGGSTTLVTAGGTVTAIACTLQSDGSAVVFYAVAGVVYRVQRTGVGAWGSAAAWSNALTSVSALSALFATDHQVLVSGVATGINGGCWACSYGAGGQVAPGTWTGLTALATAGTGTQVTYKATGVALAEVPRAALVESYAGGGAYDRAQLASGADASAFHQFAWREPEPSEVANTHGVGLAAAGGQAYLVTPSGVWNAPATQTAKVLTADVLEAEVRQGWESGRLRLVLRNEDGRYSAAATPALAAGGELRVAPGYRTTAGEETSAGMRFWVTAVRRSRAKGRAVAEVEAVDGWGVLEAWRAPRQMVWTAGTTSVYDLVRLICERAGLLLSVSPGSNESTLHKPPFTVRRGESGAAAVRRLLALVPDRVLMMGTSPVLFEPLTSDTTDYAGYGTLHPVVEVSADEGRLPWGWARVFGSGVFAEAVDVAALRAGGGTALVVDDGLTAQARATARASTVLRRQVLEVARGELAALVNAGLEVGDVVEVTEATLGLAAAKYRVAGLRLRFSRTGRAPVYEHTVQLTGL